ncbi:MAG: GxxExxY protein [Pseudomonadota bacterium]
MTDLPDHINQLSRQIFDAAVHVHSYLGAGLLEKTYEECLFFTLQKRGLKVQRQVELPIVFEELLVPNAFRLDLLVEDQIILELKSCDAISPLHMAQIFTYLKLTEKSLGMILNFNTKLMKDGIKRIAMTKSEMALKK